MDNRELLIEAHNRLRELNNSFNMTRLLMTDPEVRKEAGEMVEENRRFLQQLSTAIIFKPAHSAGGSDPS